MVSKVQSACARGSVKAKLIRLGLESCLLAVLTENGNPRLPCNRFLSSLPFQVHAELVPGKHVHCTLVPPIPLGVPEEEDINVVANKHGTVYRDTSSPSQPVLAIQLMQGRTTGQDVNRPTFVKGRNHASPYDRTHLSGFVMILFDGQYKHDMLRRLVNWNLQDVVVGKVLSKFVSPPRSILLNQMRVLSVG